MVTAVRETELKYEAEPETVVPDLTALPKVASEGRPDEQRLQAVYYDTVDLRLAAGGLTLRQRTGGDDAGWHLKLPLDADTRLELRLPLRGATVPKQFTQLLKARTRGLPLGPVARIATVRHRRRLFDADGTALAEVAVDDVSAETMGAQAVLSRWNEIEVELTGGGAGLLKSIDRLLLDAGLRRGGHTSKLARALGERLPQPPRQVRPDRRKTAGDVVVGHLVELTALLLAQDTMVRRDEPDAVHQMRVATRRLRALLRSARPLFDQARVRPLEEELRWLAAVLGTARDVEVLEERLLGALEEVPVELRLGPVKARIEGHYASDEAAARRELLAALDGPRYFALLDSLDALAAEPPFTPEARRPAKKALKAATKQAHKRTHRRMKAALAAPSGPEHDAALHEVRKAAKRARYTAEFAVPSVAGATSLGKRMKRVQTLLGEHHDTVAARDGLRQLAIVAHADGETTFTYGLLYGREERQGDAIARKARKYWKKKGAYKA